MNPLLLTDYYKTEHFKQYPKGTTLVYSNLTPRSSRLPGVNHMVFFGLQYFILEYLIKRFNNDFFAVPWEKVKAEYVKHIPTTTDHIQALHKLGYLPIEIKALPEGTLVPMRVPCLTIKNTLPEFYWVTNYLETLLSACLWQPCTSATIAFEYKKLFTKYLQDTIRDTSFVPWMGHDFSMRGMSSAESAILSGMGHLTSFTGTDTIPAIYALEEYYDAEGLIGASVPATEHSVMCAGGDSNELKTFDRLLDLYPTGILSVVSDTWDLWKVLTEYLPKLKDKILARDGKLVIRPDSGDPVDIICGKHWIDATTPRELYEEGYPGNKGVIELLWDTFGGTIVNGYKVLDPHIGAIYGDSINLQRAKEISERLISKGFAPLLVYGIGSYTYQHNTRDTFGLAMKATYCEIKKSCKGECQLFTSEDDPNYKSCANECQYAETKAYALYKDPITDDGTKKSAKGLIQVLSSGAPSHELVLRDQCTWEQEGRGELTTVFKNGKLVTRTTLAEVRERLEASLPKNKELTY